MKDCHDCLSRAELHPEYKVMAFDKIPCATCKPDLSDLVKFVQFHEGVQYQTAEGAADARKVIDLESILHLTPRQILIILYLVNGDSQREIARKVGLTPMTVTREVKKLRAFFRKSN